MGQVVPSESCNLLKLYARKGATVRSRNQDDRKLHLQQLKHVVGTTQSGPQKMQCHIKVVTFWD